MNYKLLFLLLTLFLNFNIFSKNVLADDDYTFYIPFQIPTTTDDFIKRILGVLIYLVPIIALFVIMYGSSLFITSKGNPEQIEKAKNTITWAIIGVIAVLLAYSIKTLIVKFFTG
ncbi:MAG: pilin [Minisyncoccia bacterium]